MKEVKLGLLGLGNIGGGVWDLIREFGGEVSKRTGVKLVVKKALVLDKKIHRGKEVPAEVLTTEKNDILEDPEKRFGEGTRHIVRVKSPTLVEVIAPETGYWRERELVAYCTAVIPDITFGQYMDAEDFQVMVQTCFMESENRAVVLKLAGSVRKEQNMQTADDGVSQKVTINSGISTAADVIVKNPVILTPYRTFHEVEQPESPFVLRFDEDGNPALFTGDGSKWKLEAVAAIRKYLAEALKDANVDVIA